MMSTQRVFDKIYFPKIVKPNHSQLFMGQNN